MSRIKVAFYGSLVVSFMGLIVSCGGNLLSRRYAKKLLYSSGEMPEVVYYTLKVGKIEDSSVIPVKKGSSLYRREKAQYKSRWKAMHAMYSRLEKLGLVKIISWKESEIPESSPSSWVRLKLDALVLMTSKAMKRWKVNDKNKEQERFSLSVYKVMVGNEAIVSVDDYKYVELPLCEKVVDEILGITAPSTSLDGKIFVTVEYSWRYGNFRDEFDAIKVYGKVLSNNIKRLKRNKYKGIAYFVLYDDGWRVAENHATEMILTH